MEYFQFKIRENVPGIGVIGYLSTTFGGEPLEMSVDFPPDFRAVSLCVSKKLKFGDGLGEPLVVSPKAVEIFRTITLPDNTRFLPVDVYFGKERQFLFTAYSILMNDDALNLLGEDNNEQLSTVPFSERIADLDLVPLHNRRSYLCTRNFKNKVEEAKLTNFEFTPITMKKY